MDALSHALLSFILGQAWHLDTNLQLLLVISGISLDIDAISIRSPNAAFRTHRGPVHSLLTALIASLIIGTGYTVFVRLSTGALLSAIPVSLAGLFVHLTLDLVTTGNMTVLWPISKRNFAFNLVHYIDPATLGALIIAALTAAYARADISAGRIVAAATIAFLIANYATRCYMKTTAARIVRALDARVASEILSLPTFRPDRWWVIKKTEYGNGYRYEAHEIDSVRKRILSKATIESPYINYSGPIEPPIDSPQKAVARSKKDKRVGKSIEKFLLPAVQVTSSDDRQTWQTFWYDASIQTKRERTGILANIEADGTTTVDAHITRYPWSSALTNS